MTISEYVIRRIMADDDLPDEVCDICEELLDYRRGDLPEATRKAQEDLTAAQARVRTLENTVRKVLGDKPAPPGRVTALDILLKGPVLAPCGDPACGCARWSAG